MENQKVKNKIFFEYDRFPPLGFFLNYLFPDSFSYVRNHLLPKKRRPLMLICETVNICSNDCLICAHSLMKRKKETMSLDLFKKVLQDYSDMGGGKLSLTPMIGEIFLDKFFIDRIKMVTQYPKITGLSVTTNAVNSDVLNDKELEFVLEKFERVQISIYGLDAEEYETMTCKPHFFRMLRNVKRMIEISKKRGNIIFGFRFLKDHSDQEIKTWILKNFGIEIPFNFTKTYSNWGNKIDTSIKLPFEGEWVQVKENTIQCLVPLFACQIYSNGDVSFCACSDYDITDELKLGNIKEKDLTSIYNSNKCKDLWNFDNEMPNYCKYCTFHKPISEIGEYRDLIENPIHLIGG